MNMNEKIGLQLRMKRLQKRMAMEQVADLLGVAKNTVSYMELGKKKITVDDIKQYCEVLGCQWIDILKAAEDMEE